MNHFILLIIPFKFKMIFLPIDVIQIFPTTELTSVLKEQLLLLYLNATRHILD